MARYNSPARTLSVTGTQTFDYAFTGGLITLSGTTGYIVTLVSPVFFPGSAQTFFNATTGNVTLSTPAGQITGPGLTAASSQVIPTLATYTITSDGTNYVISNNQGGALAATTGTITGTATITTSTTTPVVRGSTSSSGTLTINSTSNATKATAGILMNDGIASTSTSTGTLVITGGLGVSGTTYSALNGNVTSSNVTITGGAIDATSIGATTRSTAQFTTINANSTVTITGAISASTGSNNQSFTNTGSGVITISSGTLGSIDNMTIGLTTPANGKFGTATITSAVVTAGTVSTAPTSGNDIANKTYVDLKSSKISADGLYYGTM